MFAQTNPEAAFSLMKNLRPAEFANLQAARWILLNLPRPQPELSLGGPGILEPAASV